MPNCDFYATPDDHASLLTWLFAEGTCEVHESYSEFERPLRRFSSPDEVLALFERRYPPTDEKTRSVHLQLYVLGAGPRFSPYRVSLNPEHCDGATFRYRAEGWGLGTGTTLSGIVMARAIGKFAHKSFLAKGCRSLDSDST